MDNARSRPRDLASGFYCRFNVVDDYKATPAHNVADAYIMHRQSHRAGIPGAEERPNIWEYCTRQ